MSMAMTPEATRELAERIRELAHSNAGNWPVDDDQILAIVTYLYRLGTERFIVLANLIAYQRPEEIDLPPRELVSWSKEVEAHADLIEQRQREAG